VAQVPEVPQGHTKFKLKVTLLTSASLKYCFLLVFKFTADM
jgi:hypothetical protein